MFFYRESLPSEGVIVVASILDGDNENCIYVTLPEYNNFRGVLYKRELPRKFKLHKKTLADMKHAGTIVCVVSGTPKFSSHGLPELIELSMKGVDVKHHQNIITRHKNIEKILKIVKFVSLQFGTKYEFTQLVKSLQDTEIVPLTQIDDTEGVDNYTNLYLNHLRDYVKLIQIMNLEQKDFTQVSETIGHMIKETDAMASLEFDVFVWKGDNNNRDAVYVLRDMFEHVKNKFKDQHIDLRYLGAPKYQMTLSHVEVGSVDKILGSIKETIQGFLEDLGVQGFDLKFDIDKKDVKRGDISITFPYKIEMY